MGHRTVRLIDLQPQLPGNEHDAFAGAAAANIDVEVVRVAAKAETPAGQFLVEIVEHELLSRSSRCQPLTLAALPEPFRSLAMRRARRHRIQDRLRRSTDKAFDMAAGRLLRRAV